MLKDRCILFVLTCLALILGGCRTSPRLEVTVQVATKAVPTATAPAATPTVEPTVGPIRPPGPTLLNPTNTAVGPRKREPMSVATDAEGNVYVAWYVEPLADSRILYQRWDGESWSDSMEIGGGRYPIIAVSDGNVYVLGDAAGSEGGFVYRRSADGGDSWSELEGISVTDLAPGNVEHAILIDSAGHVHMAWSQFSGPAHSDIFYSHWDGNSWSEPIIISDSSNYANRPSLAITQVGELHFVWLSNAEGRFGLYHRYWNGSVWSNVTHVSEGSRNIEHYTLRIDREGYLHLAWYEFHGPANSEVYHSWWDGEAWSKPVNVSHDEESSEDPLFVIDENVHLIWLQSGGREGTIKHSQWDGSVWSEPESIIPPTFILGINGAVISTAGDIYLLWRVGGETRDTQAYQYGRWEGTSQASPHVLGGIGQWAHLALVADSNGNVYSIGLNVGFNRPEISRLEK